jgi:hypothetical protein
MKTDSERIAALEAKIADLVRVRSRVTHVEDQLLDAARQYARLTKLGYYMDRSEGREIQMKPYAQDGQRLADHFLREMQRLAEEILCAETS